VHKYITVPVEEASFSITVPTSSTSYLGSPNINNAYLYFIMRLVLLLLLWTSVVYACGDNSFRCKNSEESIYDAYIATQSICNRLKESTCTCYRWSETYCALSGGNIGKFKQMCLDYGYNWYYTGC
jgi:hypothetical protein